MKKITVSKSLELKIKRVIEMVTFTVAIFSLILNTLNLRLYEGMVSLFIVLYCYKQLTTDLEKFSALASKRRFWP